jgi:gamma-glutamylcyclotransferase (GGCT)/AIG2-like uncharacterized protein YtfP
VSLPYLFVYGTLRRGSRNRFARLLESRARFVGNARMQGRLFDCGRYPGVTPSDAAGDWVRGEVFRLAESASLLAKLDAYEGPLFARVPQRVYLSSGMRLAWVFLHKGNPPEGVRIICGEWRRRD